MSGAPDPSVSAPDASLRTATEEWTEIVVCMGMLVDRIDRLAARSGCASRKELMVKLASVPKQP